VVLFPKLATTRLSSQTLLTVGRRRSPVYHRDHCVQRNGRESTRRAGSSASVYDTADKLVQSSASQDSWTIYRKSWNRSSRLPLIHANNIKMPGICLRKSVDNTSLNGQCTNVLQYICWVFSNFLWQCILYCLRYTIHIHAHIWSNNDNLLLSTDPTRKPTEDPAVSESLGYRVALFVRS